MSNSQILDAASYTYSLTIFNIGPCPVAKPVAFERSKVPLPEIQASLIKEDVRLGNHLIAFDVALAILIADLGQ